MSRHPNLAGQGVASNATRTPVAGATTMTSLRPSVKP